MRSCKCGPQLTYHLEGFREDMPHGHMTHQTEYLRFVLPSGLGFGPCTPHVAGRGGVPWIEKRAASVAEPERLEAAAGRALEAGAKAGKTLPGWKDRRRERQTYCPGELAEFFASKVVLALKAHENFGPQ